jgi:hypothetical protein
MYATKVEKQDKVSKPYSPNPTLVAIFRTGAAITLLPYWFSNVLCFVLYRTQLTKQRIDRIFPYGIYKNPTISDELHCQNSSYMVWYYSISSDRVSVQVINTHPITLHLVYTYLNG